MQPIEAARLRHVERERGVVELGGLAAQFLGRGVVSFKESAGSFEVNFYFKGIFARFRSDFPLVKCLNSADKVFAGRFCFVNQRYVPR